MTTDDHHHTPPLRSHLETARLTLRPVAAADAATCVEHMNDLAISGWLARVPVPYAAADFQQFVTEIAYPGETFTIEDAQGFAGILGAGFELGYWLAPRAQGQGYATEAARAVLEMQFAHDESTVVAGYFEGNAASARVLAKLGFVETGRSLKHCRALGQDRPYVDLLLDKPGFIKALPVVAQSARLGYRPLQAVDAAALHGIVSVWEVARQLGSYPWPADPAFTATRAQPYRGAGFVWGVFLQGCLIGTVGVTGDELGYMLAPTAWGQGFASEACQTALTHAFADPARSFLIARVWADNSASQHVLAKLGFRITGETCDLSLARKVATPGYTLRLDRADWRA